MSTQLILYPQSYQGQYNSIATPVNFEFIANGSLFTGFNNTSLYNVTTAHPSEEAIFNQQPYSAGLWYRFTTTGGDYGAVTEPTYALGAVQLSHNAVDVGQTGFYQKLSGLTVNAVYDVKINIVTPQNELLTFELWDGTLFNFPVHQDTFSANTSQITTTFTATAQNNIFLIYYEGTATNLSVSKISVKQSAINPSLIYTELNDGQVICDLYQEEDIPLTLSIDDFKNVAEQVKSYSKDFNLPATKRNNQIFNNMFEVTRSDDGLIFNPYVKTQCVLKQDGFILFEGYLRLIDVKDKDGEISYNVNLYSEVIALADVLKEKTFSDLDFTELTHDYNKTQIKYSWEDTYGSGVTYLNPSTSGFRTSSTVKYPFIDWTHQYIISQNTGTSGPTFGNPQLATLQEAFKPCIQVKYLIDKIFADSGFSYTSTLFDTSVAGGALFDFDKLYMDFNWGATEEFPATGEALWDGSYDSFFGSVTWKNYEFTSNTFSADLGWDDVNNRFEATYDNTQYNIVSGVLFENDPGFGISVRWAHLDSGGVLLNTHCPVTYAPTGSGSFVNYSSANFLAILNAGDTLQLQAIELAGSFKQATNTTGATYGGILASTGGYAITTDALLQTLRGELGQWDFLKGIMTMFNLITMVDEKDPNNILIEPYADVFINNTNCKLTTGDVTLACRSIQHDWTDKIDASEMELKPLTDLNRETIFKFVEDDDDYTFNIYKDATSGHLYGSKEIDASGFTILQGRKEIIAEPFAATVSKPIDDEFPSFIIPSVYALSDDGVGEGFDNLPRIFYDNGVKDTGASYYIPEFAGLASENQTHFLQFSHLTHLPPGAILGQRNDFVFESHQLFSLGGPPTNNLYNIYWSPYFNELYNANTRTMTLKVNLSPSDIASFKFYDVVFIKNRSFRVNKIEYKPNDLATVEFILIP